jgi:hypothetical protein
MTQTEITTRQVIGKTFSFYLGGKLLATGEVLSMVSANAISLVYQVEEGVDDLPEKEFYEIRDVTTLGFDWPTKTGFRFSVDNPHREELMG